MNTTTQLSFMETTVKKTSTKPTHKCENPTCGKEFEQKNIRAKYCSASCNAKASSLRKVQAFAPQSSPSPFAGLAGLGGVYAIPPHADMMIKHHENESKRWENKYNEELKDHKETKKQLDAVTAQAKEEKNPGGLQGFAERNPEIASKLIDFAQHISTKFADKVILGAPEQPALGATEQLTGQAGGMVKLFADWIPQLTEQSQANVWTLIQALSREDEEKMNYTIKHIMQAWQR